VQVRGFHTANARFLIPLHRCCDWRWPGQSHFLDWCTPCLHTLIYYLFSGYLTIRSNLSPDWPCYDGVGWRYPASKPFISCTTLHHRNGQLKLCGSRDRSTATRLRCINGISHCLPCVLYPPLPTYSVYTFLFYIMFSSAVSTALLLALLPQAFALTINTPYVESCLAFLR